VTPGEEVWRLRDNETGRVQLCELRDNSRAGAGWEVQILEAGEILVSRHCANERESRYVAEAAKKDSLRTGSVLIVRLSATGPSRCSRVTSIHDNRSPSQG
jgi:hypothetical protein